MLLGGGRKKPQDTIDLSVGCTHIQQVGTKINRGDPLMIIHGNNADLVEQAIKLVQKSYVVTAQPVKVTPVVNDCLLEDS
jgi:thymidine phosphorylase